MRAVLFLLFIIFLAVPQVLLNSRETELPNICLSGIICDEGKYSAVINNELVREGQTIAEVKVIKIDDNGIQIEYGGEIFSKELGEGCGETAGAVSVSTHESETKEENEQVFQKKKVKDFYESYAGKLYRNAKDNFKKAAEEYDSAKLTSAYVYYKKAIKYAQWAIPLVKAELRKEMEEVIIKSRDKNTELEEEREKIEGLEYPYLRNPHQISQWLKENITYQADSEIHSKQDYWQTPQETIVLKSGDCEDTAFLAQALLGQIDIYSSVVGITYKSGDEEKAHAVCVFRENYMKVFKFFSGPGLYTSDTRIFRNLVKSIYPTWRGIYKLDLSKYSQEVLFKK